MNLAEPIHPVLSRAYGDRGYSSEAIRLSLSAKARSARLGIGPPPPAMFVVPRRYSDEVTPLSHLPPIVMDDYLDGHWIIDGWMANWDRKRFPKMAAIKAIVAAEFDVTLLDLICERRTDNIVLPRQIAMYLAKELRPDSLPTIGRHFGGRDHTTVLHAVRKITARVAADPALAERVAALKARIEAGA